MSPVPPAAVPFGFAELCNRKDRERTRKPSAEAKRPFQREMHRLREIEKVIRDRTSAPHILPHTVEGEALIKAAAYAMQAMQGDGGLQPVLRNWCLRWAPWANIHAASVLAPILSQIGGRRRDLTADSCALLIKLTLADRWRLKIATIGSCDHSKAQRAKLSAQRKRVMDKERVAAKRRAEGARPRAEYEARSLSSTKPWEAEGVSRRTWERKRAKAVASPSRLDTSRTSDAVATNGTAAAPSDAVAMNKARRETHLSPSRRKWR